MARFFPPRFSTKTPSSRYSPPRSSSPPPRSSAPRKTPVCPPGSSTYEAKSPSGETITIIAKTQDEAKKKYKETYGKPAFQIGKVFTSPDKPTPDTPKTPDRDKPPPSDKEPDIPVEPTPPEEEPKEPVMSRLEAAREWVRQFGPIPKSGTRGIQLYREGVAAIQAGKTPVKGYGAKVGIYEVQTNKGIKKFEAIDADQAKRKAESYGLDVTGDAKKVGDQKLSIPQAYERIKTAAQRSKMAAVEALITYKAALGKGFDIPAGSIPIKDKITGEVVLVDKATWEATPSKYKDIALTKGFAALQALLEKEHRITRAQEWEVKRTLGQLQLMGCGQVIPETDKPTEDEGDGWTYDLVKAIQEGFDADKLKVAFGEDAVEKAQSVVKAINKLGDDSPAWALLHNKVTKEDIELIYGEQAAKWVSDKKRQEQAHETLSQLGIKDQGKKIVAALILGQFLLSAGAEQMAYNVQGVRLASMALVAGIPSEAGMVAATVPLRLGVGVLAGLAGGAYVLTYLTGLPLNVTTPGYTKNFYNASKDAVMALPAMVVADPVGMASEIGGFILGPLGVYKLARVIGTKASPYYMPNMAARFTFSTSRLSLTNGQVADAIKAGKITPVQVANAMSRVMSKAMKSTGTEPVWARIGKSNIRIYVEATPAMEFMGSALWHASTSKVAYQALEHIVSAQGKEPASFYSLYAAPRFAMMSARGTPATSPCLVMVYTKAGRLRAYPTSIQYAKTLSTMQAKGFNYLGSGRAAPGAYGPIKTYAGRFELEAMLPNGMKINRVTNLRSRLLGASAGEFVTTVDGWVMPIYRFAQKGASVPHVGIAQLAAIRVLNIEHAIKVLIGRTGISTQAGYIAVRTLTKEFEVIGRSAMGSLKEAAARAAYTSAIDRAMINRIEVLYSGHNPVVLEKAWRENPARFEDAYLESMARLQARVTGYRTEDALYKRDSSYVTGRIRYSEPYLRRRADELTRVVTTARREYRGGPLRYTAPIGYRRPPTVRRQPTIPRGIRQIPRVPYTPRPPTKPVSPVHRLVTVGKGEKRYKLPPGSIAWKQGELAQGEEWKYIPPPWRQAKPITIFHPPIGAQNIGGRTPKETIQMIGKPRAKVPKSVSVDLGVVDILIDNYGRRIRFTGEGLKTVAGGSIASTTKGMSIPATAPQKVKGYAKLAFGTSTRSLTTETYNAAIPKKFADKILSQHLGKLSSQEIATEIKDSNVSKTRKAEILKMLPDRVRAQTELWLTVKTEYAPTRGMPKARLVPTIFRRKKPRRRKALSESELPQSASSMR